MSPTGDEWIAHRKLSLRDVCFWLWAYAFLGVLYFFALTNKTNGYWYPPIVLGKFILLLYGGPAFLLVLPCEFALMAHQYVNLAYVGHAREGWISAVVTGGATALEAPVAYILLRAFRFDPRLGHFRDLLRLITFGCGIPTLFGAILGTNLLAMLVPNRAGPAPSPWLWWVSDFITAAIWLPGMVLWLGPLFSMARTERPRNRLTTARMTEALILIFAGIFFCVLVVRIYPRFVETNEQNMRFICFLPLIWMGVRFGRYGATLLLPIQTSAWVFLHTGEEVNTSIQVAHAIEQVQAFNFALVLGTLPLAWAVDSQWRAVGELNQLTEKLIRSEGRLSGIIHSATDGIITTDADHRIVLINHAACHIFRMEPQQAIGKSITFLLPQWNTNQALGLLGSSPSRTGPVLRTTGRLSTGKDFPIEASVAQMQASDEILNTVIVRDVTERERVQNQLEKARSDAENANRAKDQFLAVLSHELRTPLTPVLLTTSMLERDDALPAEIRDDIHMIKTQVELESRLISDLLDLTRISSGKMNIVTRTMDIQPVLENELKLISVEAEEKGVEIRSSIFALRTMVRIDPDKIGQAIRNLLHNAVKFTKPRGWVELRAVNDMPDQLLIQVTDNGIGIEQGMMGKLFNPFEQAERSLSRKYGGLGLGLAITKAIIDAHGGQISARSDGLGMGATFSIILPAEFSTDVPAQSATTAPILPGVVLAPNPPAPLPYDPGHAMRILVVDDHPETLRTIERMLTGMGSKVLTADSLHSALTISANEQFDLVLSDIGLPDGTGLDLISHLRRRGPVRAIAMSGYGMEIDLQKSKAAGFSEHLIKPVDFPQLQAAINRVITRS